MDQTLSSMGSIKQVENSQKLDYLRAKGLLKRGSGHYKGMAIEPIEFIMANKLSFPVGNIIKYVCRYDKTGKFLEDLKKAQHYLELLIAATEEEQGGFNAT